MATKTDGADIGQCVFAGLVDQPHVICGTADLNVVTVKPAFQISSIGSEVHEGMVCAGGIELEANQELPARALQNVAGDAQKARLHLAYLAQVLVPLL